MASMIVLGGVCGGGGSAGLMEAGRERLFQAIAIVRECVKQGSTDGYCDRLK